METARKITGGDFNLYLDPIDKIGVVPNVHEKVLEVVNTYIEDHNLIDAWRAMHPDQQLFSWKHLRLRPVFVRLDYFLISEVIFQSVSDAQILPGYLTGHSIPTVSIDFSSHQCGPGF